MNNNLFRSVSGVVGSGLLTATIAVLLIDTFVVPVHLWTVTGFGIAFCRDFAIGSAVGVVTAAFQSKHRTQSVYGISGVTLAVIMSFVLLASGGLEVDVNHLLALLAVSVVVLAPFGALACGNGFRIGTKVFDALTKSKSQ